ncbi:hypothetical protein CK203_104433 [Vitis vinifera]|uniref:Uncharacterized protein n=1 Tax=Vitis vinifera TaxID=29760 RepID=A0A438DHD0_VITVI|nr:hypothetical protein CK203_104433 [Vitis vinifera]
MEEAKTMKTPMSSAIKLDKVRKGKSIDFTMYRDMIAFYSKATYGMGGPIISTVRGVEICLDSKNICRIFDIASIGFRVYKSKIHRDEVSYYEAFLIDSILTGKQIHLGYLMMMYMIACCESTTRVLPYGRFLTRVFKDANIDLSKETEFEAPNTYDMYDDQSMGKMKFEKA